MLKSDNKKSRKQRSDKYPLTLHPTGQYCKKIRGKIYYFGTDKHIALQRYLEQAASLHAGKRPDAIQASTESMTLKTLCNLYIEHQNSRVHAGEIKLGQVYDCKITLKDLAQYLGPNRNLSVIKTIDLQNYRSKLIAEGKSAARINNHISAFKAMYHWAIDNEVLENGPNLKAIKKLPRSKKTMTTFSSNEIKTLIECASPQFKAMILLGLNCGFGCTDCSELLWKHIDMNSGRVNFPRTKTDVARNLPLWEETISTLKVLPHINERVFNTEQGHKLVRFVEHTNDSGLIRIHKHDNVTTEFSKLLKKAGLKKEKGVGFYTLRRTAATLAARGGDPFAVQRLLGHADLKMASVYVQDVSEQTDRVINNTRKLIIPDDSLPSADSSIDKNAGTSEAKD